MKVLEPGSAVDLIAAETGLSKQKVKDTMQKGAVWLKRGSKPRKRLRRAKTDLQINDQLDIYYDPHLLAISPGKASLVEDFGDYSVWYKPPGMLSQGTQWGDHCALLRVVEQAFAGRKVFLLHRLDKEACGLIIVGHSPKAAARMGELLQSRAISKHYRALLSHAPESAEGTLTARIDGQDAETRYRVLGSGAESASVKVDIDLITGRKHQIRRHFSGIGCALVGDREYGGPSSPDGLCLAAVRLAFQCPLKNRQRDITLPESLMPDWLRGWK
ncbi:hypothetical protein BTA51_08465 [Hahella sp. CCB-MM4]|nr:hypothetical protein BTA51_08465 [Hahella sp. CCB-MM4]